MPASTADFLNILCYFLISPYSNKIKPLGKTCKAKIMFRRNNLEGSEVQATEIIGILTLECKQYRSHKHRYDSYVYALTLKPGVSAQNLSPMTYSS